MKIEQEYVNLLDDVDLPSMNTVNCFWPNKLQVYANCTYATL